MVLNVAIEEGCPVDSSRLLPTINRIKECFGKLPHQVAADAGYASEENVWCFKALLDMETVGLPKKRGITIQEMMGNEWI